MNSYYTKAEKIKIIRAHCKAQGVTFKRANVYINNAQAYQIVMRRTGLVVSNLTTIDNAMLQIEIGAL